MTPLTVSDDRTLDLEVSGPAEGPVLLFHHGTPGCRLQLPGLVRAVHDAGMRLVTWSRPGYAESSRRPGRRVADVAEDAAAVLDHLGAQECVVAGWSGGGPHALACAALIPERVRAALVLAGVAPYDAAGIDWHDGMGEDNVVEFGAAAAGESALRPMLEEWRTTLLDVTGPEVAEQLRTLVPPVDVAVLTGEYADAMAEQFRTALAEDVDGWVDDDLAFVRDWGFEPSGVRTPVQLWQGSEDLMVPYAHGTWLAERLPGVDAHLLEGEGHLSIAIGALGEGVGWLRGHL